MALVDAFLGFADADTPKLAKQIRKLDEEAHDTLESLLARFDAGARGQLDEVECKLAIRVLRLLHRASASGLARLLTVLDYLDVNANQVLEHDELSLAVEILELFCRADSTNDTLSVKELDMLHAVLRHIDTAERGRLDHDGRQKLRDELWDGEKFLADQKQNNPLLRAVLGK